MILWVCMASLLAYIRVFVSDFNTFTTLLNDTVKKNVAFKWEKEKEDALGTLKENLRP